MHRLLEGYRHPYNKKEMDKMPSNYRKNTYKCKCGHSIVIAYNCEKVVCSYCGNYVFKNKKDEFKYRMRERIKDE